MRLGILDYGAGNLRSVLNAFKHLGVPGSLVTAPEHFDDLDLLVFPGQGAFGDAARQLHERKLWQPLKDWLKAQKPYFGICLGYQLLFESGAESPGVEGLSVFKGTVPRFERKPGLKIPHMGWNTVNFVDPGAAHLARPRARTRRSTFVHSFYTEARERLAGGLRDGLCGPVRLRHHGAEPRRGAVSPGKEPGSGVDLAAQCLGRCSPHRLILRD